MGCCDTGNDDGVPFPRDLEEDGEEVERSGCYDPYWLVAILAYIGGMVGIVLWSMNSAGTDPRRLTHGSNWKGQICGVDVPEPYLYWCGAMGTWTGEFPEEILNQARVCLAECPNGSTTRIPCLLPEYHNFTQQTGGYLGALVQVESMSMVVTQTVAFQRSYPTEPYAGKFCLPARRKNNTLRDAVIDGPWALDYRTGETFGTLRRAWPLLIGVAVLTILLGYLYLFILKRFAGLLLFIVMIICGVVSLALGLFFLFAIFVDAEEEHKIYQRANPLFHMYIGWEATASSATVGVCFLILSAFVAWITNRVVNRIDEVIGVVQAAVECLEQSCELMLLPLVQGVILLGLLIVIVFVGLPWVAVLGHLDNTTMEFNGIGVKGLHHAYKKNVVDQVALGYYILGCFWLVEFYLSYGQFVVSYAVCLWYFQPVEQHDAKPNLPKQLIDEDGIGIGRQLSVRIAGLDEHYGPRRGIVHKVDSQKFLIVPVNRRGAVPGGLQLYDGHVNFDKKKASFPVIRGACVCFWHHMGSLAYGCLIVALCRPFRMFANGMGMAFEEKSEEKDEGNGDDEKKDDEESDKSLVTLVCQYLAAGMEAIFNGFSKSAYTEIVLQSCDFNTAAERAAEFIMKSGGTIAYLHGACYIYEVFGIVCLTMLGVLAFFCCCEFDVFASEDSDWYIPDPLTGGLFAAMVAGFVSFGFMQILTHTADSLMYAFAYNKKLGEFEPEEFYPGKYCPGALRYLLQPYELEAHRAPIRAEGDFSAALMRAYLPFAAPFREQFHAMVPSSSSTRRSNNTPSSQRPQSILTGNRGSSSAGRRPRFDESKFSAGRGPRIDRARPDVAGAASQLTPGSESQRELSFR